MRPLLSIVIPTRNRTEYILDSISIIQAHAPDSEVIVADNSDNDDLGQRIRPHILSGLVKYSYIKGTLSVIENFERSFPLCSGKYIVYIGDDDSIGPGLTQIAKWAESNAVDAVVSYADSFIACYFWPGVVSRFFGSGYESKVFYRSFTGKARLLDPGAEVAKVASRFGGGLGVMPRAYHGLVAKDLLDEIKRKHGAIFGGVSPDIYSATLISLSASSCYLVDYPFILPGVSPVSTAGQGAARSDRGALRANDHIGRFGEGLRWDPLVPEFYSPYTVWAFSMLKALEHFPDSKVAPDFARLYARCLLHCRDNWSEIGVAFDHWREGRGRSLGYVAIGWSLVLELTELAFRAGAKVRDTFPGRGRQALSGLPTISRAYAAMAEMVAQRGLLPLLKEITPVIRTDLEL